MRQYQTDTARRALTRMPARYINKSGKKFQHFVNTTSNLQLELTLMVSPKNLSGNNLQTTDSWHHHEFSSLTDVKMFTLFHFSSRAMTLPGKLRKGKSR